MNSKNKKIVLHQMWTTKSMVLMIFMLFLSAGMFAQGKKQVSGTVYDNTGNVLPGASIIEVGTKNGTTTDFDGKFTLEVAVGGSIEVSFIGSTNQKVQITASTQPNLEIRLQNDGYLLSEVQVVAVGYGTQKKSDLTGAISTVGADDLVKGTISSTEQVLQGKVAGLNVIRPSGDPSAGSSLRLRGGTSLTASNSPLIVVDGIAGVDINVVQPSDIKSVDVLKDASATAIYGSRGANGVIIITTKSGTKGVSIVYNGMSSIGYVSNHLDLLSANQWRAHIRETGNMDAVDYGANTDWQKELEQTAISQSHTLSINSGKADSGFRTSISYLDNQGVIKTTGLERLSANVNAYQYLGDNKDVKFDTGLFANIDKWHPLDYRIFERSYNLNPTIPVYDANGEFTSVGGTIYENPVEILTNRKVDNQRHRLLGYFKTEVKFLNDFQAVANISLEHNAMKGSTYKPSYAVMEGRTEDGYAQKTYAEYTNAQGELYVNYSKVFDKHSISALAGYSYLENIYQGFGAQRSGFVTDEFSYNNLGAGYNYRLGDVYSYKGKSNLVSFYARANYNYDGKYLLTGTVRRDGSSRFGENNKWGVFPSASAAWRISNEEFMSSAKDWLGNLKLRVGYGVTGNQDGIGEYKSLSILGVGNDSYYDPATGTWSLAYSPKQNPNPDLKWESTEQLNVGVDFSLFDRVTGSFEWYSKTTKDLLYTYEVPQPPYLVGNMLANVGEMSNKGVELTLNADIIKGDKFTWDANVTLGHNVQKIEKLSNTTYETDVIYSGSLHGLAGMSGQYSQIIAEGYPVGTFWGFQNAGLDADGKMLYVNAAGEKVLGDALVDADKKDLGNIQPDLTLGIGMNFTYGNFDLGISGYGMFGQKALNATNMMLNDPNRLPAYNVPDDFLNSGITSAPKYSDYWIEDASFFRLQTLSIGYTLPLKYKGSKLRLYLMGENLAVFTSYKGVDPEIGLNAQDGSDQSGLAAPGIDKYNNYPRPTTVSVGLNFTLNN
ncbi:SusC/RagA family TonB-linked outer membrane protein [Flavobacterium sp. GA093]|uniref:SusC/RagA family TonB-linked outer membrane protein n=1 Tax=Flavobacterium hydrocarbonoxydans TaxID=2683249 RepID=A0A6I4NNX6_9FLAO|nr:TonB-dependent receptor [Flavobacterium hydrocarbonoxydans]MWB92894.1 SusC/RagA family TonB-linked outer membrane protein [Flavobacterium hydrocarbonoxydans]